MGYVSSDLCSIERSKPSSIFSAFHLATLIATLVVGLGYFAFPPLTGDLNDPIRATDSSENLESYQAAGKDILLSDASAGRAVYPYSVIPGGVLSSKELGVALRIDSVAREHYADFNVGAARIIRVAANRKAYVSYRKGGTIFWTRKQVNLHAGETLLSDGEHLARTRCGNRVSAVPRAPVSPDEPEETAGDAPVGPPFPLTTTDANLGSPAWRNSPDAPVVLTAVNLNGLPMPREAGGGQFFSGVPGSGCCFGFAPVSGSQTTPPTGGGGPPESGPQSGPQPGSGGGPSGPWTGPTGPAGPGPEGPGTVPVATPEPSSLLLLGAGLAAASLFLKLRRS
jgi:hypothetical protein